jgi:hypothetical protein
VVLLQLFAASEAVYELDHGEITTGGSGAAGSILQGGSTGNLKMLVKTGVTLSFEGSSSNCVHVPVCHSGEAFPLIIHGKHDAMDARTRHSGLGS